MDPQHPSKPCAAAAGRLAGGLPAGFKRRLGRQLAIEFGPLILFFLAFSWQGIYAATAVYAVAALLALGGSWWLHRRLPVVPLVATVLVVIFAGLTLALGEAMFIKIKPTVVNGFFALVLGIGWFCGFRLIDRSLGDELKLDEEGQRILTWRAVAYLVTLACLNEIVWRTLPTDTWVVFKVFILICCNVVFALCQLPLIRAHRVDNGEASRADPVQIESI